MYRLLTALLLLIACSAFAAIWPQPQRLAIVVNQQASDGDRGNRDATLADALSRYFAFYFSATGYSSRVVMTNLDQKAAQQLAADSACDMLLLINVTGDLKTKTTLRRTDNRRERFFTTHGLLSLRANVILSERRDTKWQKLVSDRFSENADLNWIDQFGPQLPDAIRSAASANPEPIEYVLQRLVERTVRILHLRSRDDVPLDTLQSAIPITVLVDQSYVTTHRQNWTPLVAQTIAATSRLYASEFGVRFRPHNVVPTRLPFDSRAPIRDLYNALSHQFGSRQDTLLLALYATGNPLRQVMGADHDEIGLSGTGDNLILIRDLPMPRSIDSRWSAQFTSLNFAHELGHRFGAIHVSDPQSLMNHTLSWLAPSRLDPLNRTIIAAALHGNVNLLDSAAYASFVAEAIDSAGYNLADLPAFFYRVLPSQGNTTGAKSPFARVKPVYFLAAQGYGHFVHGELPQAAELFRKAIALAPDQASLHFYLANCTGGDESRNAWRTAANLGYWQAQLTVGDGRKP